MFALSVAGLMAGGNAAGAPPSPSTERPSALIVSASTDNTGLGGAIPDVLVEAGEQFQLTVTLDPPGSTFASATALKLTPSLATGGQPHGTLSPATVEMPGGVTSQTFDISYSAVDNQVVVTAEVAKANSKVTPGATAPFDVLKVVEKFAANDPQLAQGLGVGDADCTQATTEPECGTLVLSKGMSSQIGALSLGACTPDLGCTPGSQVVQFIGDLGDTYTPQDPALLIIRCAKRLCKGKGLQNYPLNLSFDASGPLDIVSKPCVSKGVALDAAGNEFCTDLVQSHRDNVGAALLYLLFTGDMRGST